jgi:hypothetical protein
LAARAERFKRHKCREKSGLFWTERCLCSPLNRSDQIDYGAYRGERSDDDEEGMLGRSGEE